MPYPQWKVFVTPPQQKMDFQPREKRGELGSCPQGTLTQTFQTGLTTHPVCWLCSLAGPDSWLPSHSQEPCPSSYLLLSTFSSLGKNILHGHVCFSWSALLLFPPFLSGCSHDDWNFRPHSFSKRLVGTAVWHRDQE